MSDGCLVPSGSQEHIEFGKGYLGKSTQPDPVRQSSECSCQAAIKILQPPDCEPTELATHEMELQHHLCQPFIGIFHASRSLASLMPAVHWQESQGEIVVCGDEMECP